MMWTLMAVKLLIILVFAIVPIYYAIEVTADAAKKYLYPIKTKQAVIKTAILSLTVAALLAFTLYIPVTKALIALLTL